jgi:hypothetical protein
LLIVIAVCVAYGLDAASNSLSRHAHAAVRADLWENLDIETIVV